MSEQYTTLYGIFINGMNLQQHDIDIVDIYNFCKESLGLEHDFSKKIYVFENVKDAKDTLEHHSIKINSNVYEDEDMMDVDVEPNSIKINSNVYADKDMMDVNVEPNSIFISFLPNEIVNEVDETTKNNLLMCLYNAFIKRYTCGIISYTVQTELLEKKIKYYMLSQIIHVVTQGREEAERLKEEQEQRLKEKQEYEKKMDKNNIDLEVKKRKKAFYDLKIRLGHYDWVDRDGNIKKDIPPAILRDIKEQAEKYYFKHTKPKNKKLEQERRNENEMINEKLAARARAAANEPYNLRKSTWRDPRNKDVVIIHGFNLKGSPKGGKKKSKKVKKSKNSKNSKKSKKANKSKKAKKSKK
jgi:hypothetical protein